MAPAQGRHAHIEKCKGVFVPLLLLNRIPSVRAKDFRTDGAARSISSFAIAPIPMQSKNRARRWTLVIYCGPVSAEFGRGIAKRIRLRVWPLDPRGEKRRKTKSTRQEDAFNKSRMQLMFLNMTRIAIIGFVAIGGIQSCASDFADRRTLQLRSPEQIFGLKSSSTPWCTFLAAEKRTDAYLFS